MQTFDCSKIGIRNYKINVSDAWGYTNESSDIIEIRPDSIEIEYVSAPTKIDRELGNTQGTFVMRVKDLDRDEYLPEGKLAAFYFTKDGINFDTMFTVNTNSSGHIIYTLDPDCSYSVGIQKWDSGIIDYCYIAENYTQRAGGPFDPPIFNVTGQLKNNLELPVNGAIFNVTQPITIRFNTTSDCSAEGLIANASVSIELISPYGEEEVCSPIANEYDGWYNCTWNSTGKREGYWSIRLNSSLIPLYNFNSTTYINRLWLENVYTKAENFSVYIWNSSINSWQNIDFNEYVGWSNKFNFTVDVYDQEGDTVECRLLISKNNGTTWEYVGSSVINGISGIPTTGTCSVVYHGFDCNNIGTNNWFKFEIRDAEQANYYNTTEINAPKLRESIAIISLVEGNNSFVNRSSGINQITRLAVNVFDLENSSYARNVNVSFWITRDGSNYLFDSSNATESSGNAYYYFNPDCSYSAGPQYWKAGITDTCYIDVNTTDYTTTIIGDLVNTLIQPLNGETFLRGSNVTIRANVSDECGNLVNVDGINFISKSNETLQDFYCEPIINEGIGYYNCTFNTSYPTLMPARYYNITINTSKQYFNPAQATWKNAFFIETKPELFNISAYPSGDGGWGETWYFIVSFTDEDLDSNTVFLYINRYFGWISPSSQLVSGKNVTLTFSYSGFSGDDIGERQFYFTAQDVRGYTSNSSVGNFTLDKDDVLITHIYGNNSVYNRSASPSLNFRVNVTDIDRNVGVGANRQGIFYYTKDGNNFVSSSHVYTDISSNLTLSGIQVDCSFQVGPQRWIAGIIGDNWYKNTNSTTFYFTIITTNLTTNLTYPLNKSFLRGIDDILFQQKLP